MAALSDTPDERGSRELHFLFGVAPRSGTTYLGDLLALHPRCALPADLPEDGFLKALGALDGYVAEVQSLWQSWPDLAVPTSAELRAAVGAGLGDLLCTRSGAEFTLSKTPYPTNLHRLREVFPDSKAVVIIRDGRSVTESMVRTWSMRFDMAAALFRDGARSVLQAIPNPDSPPAHLHLVRYEDLFEDTQRVLNDVLGFFGLEADEMPSGAIADLPVRGSSTARGDKDGAGDVHWEAVKRPADFNPVDRWSAWDERQHRKFAAVAGPENVALGYDAATAQASDRATERAFSLRRTVARWIKSTDTRRPFGGI
ncbi:MAG: sulfotransferase [Acidimicrobiia bacterium]|nr:sulfotransferase [Acidimicrobiia bacterium]